MENFYKRMRCFFFIIFLLMPTALLAQDHAAFHGTWGTPEQCKRLPLKSGGTVLASPFEIEKRWLKQGSLWCSLNWGPVEKRQGNLYSSAHAQCGEDAVRNYFLGMKLSDNKLTLRWHFPKSNGPLAQCPSL